VDRKVALFGGHTAQCLPLHPMEKTSEVDLSIVILTAQKMLNFFFYRDGSIVPLFGGHTAQ
jgi:hypothetical protein